MQVETDDLIDANDVAALLGLSHRNTVSQYLIKYRDMPRPVIDLGPKRPRLWLRPEIEAWLARRGPVRRGRPAKRSSTGLENFHPPSGGVEVARGGRKPRAASAKRAASTPKTGRE